eukprot:Hpha_TRINITY_DN16030_c1_g1::TRINITY_DN16030_c1_g1_i2::g.120801::m.120801
MEQEEGSKCDACKWKCSTLLIRHGDSPEDIRIKRELTPVMVFLASLNFVVVIHAFMTWNPMFVASYSIICMAALTFLILGRLGRPPMMQVLKLIIMMFLFGILIHDLHTAANLWPRSWSFVVLLLDAALVFNVPGVIPFTLTVTLIYLLFERIESGWRFGVYDTFRHYPSPTLCDCASPPCTRAAGNVIWSYVPFPLVLLIDFYLTRGFATGLRRQLRRMEASAEVAGRVAGELARYDVDEAERAIDEGEDLPAELAESYRQLLSNLRTYRAYLPTALLEDDSVLMSPRGVRVAPPGAVGGEVEVGMVFTDIQSSTELWETMPQAVHEGLRVHNSTLRGLAGAYQGYEVKIIGDSLMLAFGSAANALGFGAEAQLRLAQAEWPPPLCEHPLCKLVEGPFDTPLWNGVRVRIGVHFGGAQVEINPVTGRYDFLGPTVNTASRVESALKYGGLTGATQVVLDEAGPIDHLFTAPFGETELKGVGRPIDIIVVLPRPLERRWAEVQGVMGPDTAGIAPVCSFSYHSSEGGIRNWSPPITPPLSGSMRRLSASDVSPVGAMLRSPRALSRLSEPPPVLTVGLDGGMATCCTVRADFRQVSEREAEQAITRFLVGAETAALRTDGQVVGVVSAVCVVGWNSGRLCPHHVAQGAHFVKLFSSSGLPVSTGAATGRVMSGTILATRRRYVTMAGSCVELSIALADAANLDDVPFMAAGEVGAHLDRS